MILQNLSLIVAVDERNAIGYKGGLLCHLPDDLKHFKELTTGHAIIMGRKTYESLPKRPLPNRRNIVLSRRAQQPSDVFETINSLEEVYSLAHATKDEIFVIGGQSLYEQLIQKAAKIYLTRIHHTFEKADAFFPPLDKMEWKCTQTAEHPTDENHAYSFCFETYEKIG